MNLEIRKFTKFVDKTFIEGGKKAKEPVLLVSVAAVFKNPWHEQGFVEGLVVSQPPVTGSEQVLDAHVRSFALFQFFYESKQKVSVFSQVDEGTNAFQVFACGIGQDCLDLFLAG